MSEEFYSHKIMIGKPKVSISFSFTEIELELLEIKYISQLIDKVKTINHCVEELISDIGMKNSLIQTTYVKYTDYFLALHQDKALDEVFSDLDICHLQFIHFYVPGDGSVECNGYRFTVHSNEANHQ